MAYPRRLTVEVILDEALCLVRESGLEALSMRELAAALGVRASSLYRHYPARADIEEALASRAAQELESRLRASLYGRERQDHARAVAWEYLRFAREDPALFVLLTAVPERDQRLHAFFLELAGGTESGAAAFWSFLHGFVILDDAGQLGSHTQNAFFAAVDKIMPWPAERFAASAVS